MSKQDRQGVRTPADLERKYKFGQSFAEAMGIATDANEYAKDAKAAAAEALAAVNAFDTDLDQDEIFNRLTKGGKEQGLYLDKEKIYVNATYIKAGTLSGDRIDGATLNITRGAKIAGWGVDNSSIYKTPDGGLYKDGTFVSTGTNSAYSIGGSEEISRWVFGAGGRFGVTKDGAVYANDVHLQGEINADSGNIGYWEIKDGHLTSTRDVPIISGVGTTTWSQKAYLEPDGIRVVLTYKNGNPVPEEKELERKLYWYELAGLNVASVLAE